MSDANIVPFGKYKGQSVEIMMTDAAYCEWALAQPWFRDRFAALFAIIVNGGAAPDACTPEHNRMQTLFLDGEMIAAAIRSISTVRWYAGLVGRRESPETAPEMVAEMAKRGAQFEVNGWDVMIDGVWEEGKQIERLCIELKPLVGDDYPAILRKMKTRIDADRRRGGSDSRQALVIDRFEAEGATYDQVVKMFAASGIKVRTLAEIRALVR